MPFECGKKAKAFELENIKAARVYKDRGKALPKRGEQKEPSSRGEGGGLISAAEKLRGDTTRGGGRREGGSTVGIKATNRLGVVLFP